MRILIQFPEGLRKFALKKAKELEKNGNEVILFCEPCYGACDLRDREAKLLDCEKILHLGHRDFGIKSEVPVEYLEIKAGKSLDEILSVLEKNFWKLKGEKEIAIASNPQFEYCLPEIKKFLEGKGIKVKNLGAILGCSEFEEKEKCALFVGDGRFHALALNAEKLFFLDLEKNRIEEITELLKKFEMKKLARIEKFKEAKKIGVLVSTKKGQFYPNFFELKKKLEDLGKDAKVLVMDEIKEEKLLGFYFDCYLNTACPRIVDHFSLPMVNLREIKELL